MKWKCDNKPLPYFCDFTNADVVKCWNTVDVDLDGDCLYFGSIELTSDYGYIGYGVSQKGLPANDWLISPSFTVGVGAAAEELGKCFRRTVCSEKMWYL